MSVNSATDSFTDGAELFDQEKYQSTVTTSIEPDPVQMEQTFNRSLSRRIIAMHSPTKSIYGESRLDDVIVRCPSEAFREHQKQQWSVVKTEAEEKSWNWTVTAIGTGLGAAAGGVLLAMGPTDVAGYLGPTIANSQFAPFLLVVGGIAAAAAVFFAWKENSSVNQAHTQINKWGEDPVMKVGLARNEAHKQGFPYIFANNLKLAPEQPSTTALFHPIQVKYEYEKYFETYCTKLLSQVNPSPAAWVEQFRSCNPVSSAYMTYGLGHVPEHMKPVIEDYTRFETFLNDISTSYDKMKSDVRATAKESIDSYTKTKNEQLQPLAQARDTGIATAEADKDRVLRDLTSSERRRREARETFNAIKDALDANYTRSAASITREYDEKIKETERDRDVKLRKLDEQKGGQLSNNYRAARELLERATQAWDNKGYHPMNFQQYSPYQNAQQVWIHQQPVPAPVYYQQPVQQQPVYYQQQPPVYQQPVQPVQQQPSYVQPQPNPGFGQYVYGQHVQAQIPAQQHYYYNQPVER